MPSTCLQLDRNAKGLTLRTARALWKEGTQHERESTCWSLDGQLSTALACPPPTPCNQMYGIFYCQYQCHKQTSSALPETGNPCELLCCSKQHPLWTRSTKSACHNHCRHKSIHEQDGSADQTGEPGRKGSSNKNAKIQVLLLRGNKGLSSHLGFHSLLPSVTACFHRNQS